MANLSLIGAVGIRVRPDTDGFKKETKAKVLSELSGVEGEVKVKPKVDANEAAIRSRVKQMAHNASTDVHMKVVLDDKLASEGLKRLEDATKRKNKIEVKVDSDLSKLKEETKEAIENLEDLRDKYHEFDKVSLANVARQTKALEEAQRKTLKATDDLTEAQEKLARTKTRLDEAGDDATAKMRNDYTKAEESVASLEKAYERMKSAQESANKNLAKAIEEQTAGNKDYAKSIAEANVVLEQREAKEAKETKTLNKLLKAEQDLHTIQAGSWSEVSSLIKNANKEGEHYSDTLHRILESVEGVNKADFAHLFEAADRGFAKDSIAKVRVEADTAMAEAKLQWLERDRVVRLTARTTHGLDNAVNLLRKGGSLDSSITNITNKYANMFAGGARAVTSLGQINRMTTFMAESAANMDTMALSASKLTMILGSVGGTILAATGSISALGKSLVAMSKGALIAPAALGALGVAFGTTKQAVSVFGKALSGNSEDLTKYSKQAASASDAVSKMFKDANNAGMTKFFANSADQISRLEATLKPMASLWERSYDAQGKFFSGILQGVNQWYDRGDMSKTVDNIAKSLMNASGAGKPFAQSLLDITTVGSKYLPQLGTALTDVTKKWASFISASKSSGQMDQWIQEAGRQVKYLGSSVGSTIGILGAFGKAADAAGYGGLRSLSESLDGVSKRLNSSLYQNGMTNIFRGAKEGAQQAGDGFRHLADSIMLASKPIGEMEAGVGKAMGSMTTNIGNMVTHSGMLKGVSKFINDIGTAAGNSGPMMINMGNAFGQAASTAGELVKAAQRISDAFFRVWGDMDGLTEGVNAVIPVFADFAVKALDIAHVFTGALGEALGSALKWFSGLPAPIQEATIAAGLLVGVIAKFGGLGGVVSALGNRFPALANSIDGASNSMKTFQASWSLGKMALAETSGGFNQARKNVLELGNGFTKAGANAGAFRISMEQMRGGFSGIGSAIASTVRNVDSGSRAFEGFGKSVGNVTRGALGAGAAGLRGALSGVMGVLGGPWGIALMAAGAAISYFANKSAEAKRQQSELKGTLDETGQATAATTKQITDNLNEQAESYSGVWLGSKRLGEAMSATGMSAAQMAQDIANSGEGMSSYRQNLQNAVAATADLNNVSADLIGQSAGGIGALIAFGTKMADATTLTEEQSEAFFGTKDAAGMTHDELMGLTEEYDKQKLQLQAVQKAQKDYAEAMGITTSDGKALADAMKTINDATSSTAQKAGAFKTALDVMNNGSRSLLETNSAQISAMGQLDQAFQAVADAGEGGAGAMTSYKDALGNTHYALDSTKSSLGSLQSALLSSFDATVDSAQAMYDGAIKGGTSIGDAAELANQGLETWRQSAQQQLQSMGVDAEKAKSMLDDIAGKPWMAEITFMGKTEQFMTAQQAVKAKGEELDGEAFTAFLKANPNAANEDIKNLVDKGINWSSSVYSATLDADKGQAQGQIDEIIHRGETFNAAEYQAMLKGDNSGFLDSYIAAESKGESLNDTEYRASIGMTDEAFDKAISDAKAQGVDFASNKWIARMDIENPGFAEKLFAARHDLEGIAYKDWPVEIQNNFQEVMNDEKELSSGLGALDGKVSEVTVKSNAAAQAIILEAYRLKASGMDNQKIQQTLSLNDEEWKQVTSGLPGEWNSIRSDIESKEAFLNANADLFKDKEELAKQDWSGNAAAISATEAYLTANPDRVSEAGELAKQNWNGSKAAIEQAQAYLMANPDKVSEAGKIANQQWDGDKTAIEQAKAYLDANPDKVDEAGKLAGQKWDGNAAAIEAAKAYLDANPDKIDEAGKLAIQHWDGSKQAIEGAEAFLKANPNDIDLATQIANQKWAGTKEEIEAATAYLQANPDKMDEATEIANGKWGSTREEIEQHEASLKAKDDTQSGIDDANIKIAGFADDTNDHSAKIGVDTTGLDTGLADADSKVQQSWVGKTFDALLGGNTGPMGVATSIATGIGNMFQGNSFLSSLSGNTNPMSWATGIATGIGQSFMGSNFMSSLSGNTNPMAGSTAQATGMGQGFSLMNFLSTLSGNNAPFQGSKGSAVAAGQVFGRSIFTGTLAGDANPARQASRSATRFGQGYAEGDYTGEMKGDPRNAQAESRNAAFAANAYAMGHYQGRLEAQNNASGVVQGLLGLAGRWAGQVFTATFNAVKKGLGFSTGGLLSGKAIQAFATGGIRTAREASAIQKKMNSPRTNEVHRAQIARPSTHYRVWAEEETGGEAYIPLASSKRGRSTEILSEVADRFGLTVSKYADGGMEYVGGASPNGGSTSTDVNINYNRLSRTIASALAEQGVRVTNPGDFKSAAPRR